MLNFETEFGEINFSQNVINRIVTEAVATCDGKVEIHHYRGRYRNVVPGLASRMNLYDEEAGGIQIREGKEGLSIKVYVVVSFGTSIKNVTEKIIDYIYEHTEETMGVKPGNVKVIVTGTLSKNIAKRHIEVSR